MGLNNQVREINTSDNSITSQGKSNGVLLALNYTLARKKMKTLRTIYFHVKITSFYLRYEIFQIHITFNDLLLSFT